MYLSDKSLYNKEKKNKVFLLKFIDLNFKSINFDEKETFFYLSILLHSFEEIKMSILGYITSFDKI